MKKYEVIFFDADDTLFDFKKAEKYALEKTIRSLNLEYDESYHLRLYSTVNKAVWMEFEQGLLSAEDLKTERFKRLFEKIKLDFDPRESGDFYLKALAEASFLLDGAADLVDYLKDRYRLAIITNGFSMVQKKRIRESAIAPYIESVIISEEVNFAKPEQEIFRYAMERIGHQDKKTVLMVGDSLSSDIAGGVNFAIDTCWFNPGKNAPDKKIVPDYEIHSLAELKKIL